MYPLEGRPEMTDRTIATNPPGVREQIAFNGPSYPIAMINFLRDSFGIGLKEAHDIHFAILESAGIPTKEITDHMKLLVTAGSYRSLTDELAKATGELVRLRNDAEAARKCVTCGIHLEDGEVGACSTFCFEQHREKLSDQRRVVEINRQIEGLKRDISDLENERAYINERLRPEANEDGTHLILEDDYPF
jgi:hypothetical protein